MTAAVDLETWLASRRQAVDAALERALPAAGEAPGGIREAMRYSVFAGGKRLRPLLVLASAEAVGGRAGVDEDTAVRLAMPAACALELIHTYSLVHDDLPAMDDDTLRRGRPTAHVVYGEGLAILAGDALLTEAFALLAREPGPGDIPAVSAADLAVRKLGAIAVIAEAAGADGMAGGQAIDLQAAAPGAPPLDDDALGDMHARKTGALLRAATVAGAILAGGPPDVVAAISVYGMHLGLAFQIVDDILDVEGASATLGKTAGKDAAAGKPTYPARYGLDESKRRAAESIRRAAEALEGAGLTGGGHLPAIAQWVLTRRH